MRRDLQALDAEGLLRRTHGGATVPRGLAREPSYAEKARQAAPEKAAIAQAAAQLVQDDMTIALGAGTTTLALARLLCGRERLRVLSSSLLACQALATSRGVRLICTGGDLRVATQAFVGPFAERMLTTLHVDAAFLSGNGLTGRRGLSTPDPLQASLDQRLAGLADLVVVLADYTKVGVETTYQTVAVGQADHLITDIRASQGELGGFRAAGTAVTVVEPARAVGDERGQTRTGAT